MRLAIIVSVVTTLLVVPAAIAQPVPAPARCDVHILRAPENVRARIEARVRQVPRCETSLVLRVVPTTTGLYLLAHTPSGRAYEMVVPDADTAAELIAKWAARREAVTPVPPAQPLAPPPIAPPPVRASPVISDSAVFATPRVRPPGVTPESSDGAVTATKGGKWLAVAGVVGDDVYGLRAELDLWSKGAWAGGIALEGAETQMTFLTPQQFASFSFEDLRAMLTVGHTLGRGAWQLRSQLGAGVIRTKLSGTVDLSNEIRPVDTSGTFPTGEAAIHLVRTVGDRWALSAGPLLTLYSQTFRFSSDNMMATRRDVDLVFVAAVRRRI